MWLKTNKDIDKAVRENREAHENLEKIIQESKKNREKVNGLGSISEFQRRRI